MATKEAEAVRPERKELKGLRGRIHAIGVWFLRGADMSPEDYMLIQNLGPKM